MALTITSDRDKPALAIDVAAVCAPSDRMPNLTGPLPARMPIRSFGHAVDGGTHRLPAGPWFS
jgi:hypothetical protein